MNIQEAADKLKSHFPDKYVCIKEEVSISHQGNIESSYEGYVDGFDYISRHKSFEDVIMSFTRRTILNRKFNTKFIVKKCDTEFCDALNKTFSSTNL